MNIYIIYSFETIRVFRKISWQVIHLTKIANMKFYHMCLTSYLLVGRLNVIETFSYMISTPVRKKRLDAFYCVILIHTVDISV